MTQTRHHRTILLLILLFSSCLGQNDWICERPCKCKWVSGKKTADCVRQDLTEIPSNLSSKIQTLDLTGNFIPRIEHDAFSQVKLVNLHKLVLKECQIEAVHSDAFNGLQIVIEIDLSMNKIRALHPGTFAETQRLRVLLLNNNNLEVLEAGLFSNLTYLQKIILSENQLKKIEDETFQNLPGLHTLILHSNNLSNLRASTFDKLQRLGSLELHSNPWNCNCLLKKFRDWVVERKLYAKPTTCKYPVTLTGKMWDEIESDEFACLPKIVYVQPEGRFEVAAGDEANLACHALGSPRPAVFWVHRSTRLTNVTNRRRGSERNLNLAYVIKEGNGWSNLTIPGISVSDRGDYICVAQNFGGSTEKNITMAVTGELVDKDGASLGLPLAIGLGVIIFLLILLTLALYLFYCKKKKPRHNEKGPDAGVALEHHGLVEQEKSLIATMNPVLKSTNRRYENQSAANFRGTEMTELNRTLLDNDSIFAADGVSSGGGSGHVLVTNGLSNGSIVNGLHLTSSNNQISDDRDPPLHTPELDIGESGTLPRGSVSYRQYPPDLLAFSGGRGVSPTSQASTAPDNSRLPTQFTSSPNSSQFCKTLPHNRSGGSYMSSVVSPAPVLPRYGYVTIPRRPRAPSWGSTTSPSVTPQTGNANSELTEPVYDNLGRRTTADGSSKRSLLMSPEPVAIAQRPLPATPSIGSSERAAPSPCPPISSSDRIISSSSAIIGSSDRVVSGSLTPVGSLDRVAHAPFSPVGSSDRMVPPSFTPIGSSDRAASGSFNPIGSSDRAAHAPSPFAAIGSPDRAAPEGAPDWSSSFADEIKGQNINFQSSTPNKKIPPRPPPKPKKKMAANGPLYEDEGEDGTEV